MTNKKIKLFIITGATGIGKSLLAVELAKATNANIISADSMQIYRGMDIGTGKITNNEKQGILHYMLDVVAPDISYNVDDYIKDTTAIIDKLSKNGTNIIIVGGTGLYISALVQGFNLAAVAPNWQLRGEYQSIADTKGH